MRAMDAPAHASPRQAKTGLGRREESADAGDLTAGLVTAEWMG